MIVDRIKQHMVRRLVKMEATDLEDQWRVLQESYKMPTSLLHAVRVKAAEARDRCLWPEWSFWTVKYERLHDVCVERAWWNMRL